MSGDSSPIARFLGESATQHGPFGLIGIRPDQCDEQTVITSLERRLDALSRHPECGTPEADEVRLALHASAAQLLDPTVRRHLTVRWFGKEVAVRPRPAPEAPTAEGGQSATAPATPALSELDRRRLMLEQDALRTLAMFGGWNQKALMRLAALAHARGLPSTEVTRAVSRLARQPRRSGPTSGQQTARRPITDTPSASCASVAAQNGGAASARRSTPAPARPGASRAAPPSATSPTGARVGGTPARAQPSARPRPAAPVETRRPPDEVHASPVLRQAALTMLGIFVVIGLTVIAFIVFKGPGESGPAPEPIEPTIPFGGTDTTGSSGDVAAPTVAESEGTDAEDVTAVTEADADSNRQVRFQDPALVLRRLRTAADQARDDPDGALESFVESVHVLAAYWPRFDVGRRKAATDAIVEFFFATSDSDEAQQIARDIVIEPSVELTRVASSVALEAHDVWPVAWSVGMLARLERERELSRETSQGFDRALEEALGRARVSTQSTFEDGVTAALRRMPERIVLAQRDGASSTNSPGGDAPVRSALRRWLGAAEAIADGDEQLVESLVLTALEQTMQAADPSNDQAAYVGIEELTLALRWRADGQSRSRLLGWFDDQAIENSDLHVLTTAVAMRSSAEGIDPTMVLSARATRDERFALRDRYASAWSIRDRFDRDSVRETWVDHATAAEQNAVPRDPYGALREVLRLSYMNDAASAIWEGRLEGIGARRTQVEGVMRRSESEDSPFGDISSLRSGPTDGNWALNFLAAGRNIPVRLNVLAELRDRADTIGPIDGEVLAEAACFAQPVEVKHAAQQIVMEFGTQPGVINGLLEVLPRAPQIRSVGRMIDEVTPVRLPPVTAENWELEARRALVELLLEMVASGLGSSVVESMAGAIAVTYGARSGDTSGTVTINDEEGESAATEEDVAILALQAATALLERRRQEAVDLSPGAVTPLTLDEIGRKLDGRLSLASGPVQQFAAQQVAIAEYLAFIVAAERPTSSDQVVEILDAMTETRRGASHIFHQLLAAERAMTRLWLLRLEGGNSA